MIRFILKPDSTRHLVLWLRAATRAINRRKHMVEAEALRAKRRKKMISISEFTTLIAPETVNICWDPNRKIFALSVASYDRECKDEWKEIFEVTATGRTVEEALPVLLELFEVQQRHHRPGVKGLLPPARKLRLAKK